jgi:hypothetical protein
MNEKSKGGGQGLLAGHQKGWNTFFPDSGYALNHVLLSATDSPD